jgi:parallel beta-helix repeat protein
MGLLAVPAVASAATLHVANPTDTSGCGKNAPYHTIQSAVNAAMSGDHIMVCPGTYPEHVVVPAGKDNINIEGTKTSSTFVQFPSTPPTSGPDAIFLINGAKNTEIHHLTVRGPWSDDEIDGCAQPTHYGIYVEGGGSARIHDNVITMIQDLNQAALGGCQDGLAVRIGSYYAGQTGSGQIEHNVITDYQKNGVTIDGPGTRAQVDNNTIIGDSVDPNGVNPYTARNGVQFGREAAGEVNHNAIADNAYAGAFEDDPAGNEAAGILAFEVTGGVQINDNTLTANDYGLDLGVGTANEDGGALTVTTGVLFSNNKATNNRFDGFRAENDAQQNTLKDNKANGTSPGHDCRDASMGSGTAGTANTWQNDQGQTSNPPGICKAH